jgi:hypothetical protein
MVGCRRRVDTPKGVYPGMVQARKVVDARFDLYCRFAVQMAADHGECQEGET